MEIFILAYELSLYLYKETFLKMIGAKLIIKF